MRIALLALLFAACAPTDDGEGDTGPIDADTDTDADTDDEEDFDPYEIGRALPAFTLLDINPTSASYDQVIDSTALGGHPYAMVFLDSRCEGCLAVAVDLWAVYQERQDWWESLPTFAVQSPAGMESPETTAEMVVGHDMPYLADTWEQEIWFNYGALNHDFFVVSAEGTLDAYIPLWTWPDDMASYLNYMEQRFDQ